MAKLNTNSNTYTIIYASVMVIIVAFLLAFVASSLKDTQDANVARDVKGQILSSVRISGLEGSAVDAKYNEVITENSDGTYTAKAKDGEKLIIPLKGAGLWGPIWGYLSIEKDGETVYGAFFNHEGETAGLGARVKDDPKFAESFQGKKLYDAAGEIALSVVKKGKEGSLNPDNYVNGVTGATLTSDGVHNMVQSCLGQYENAIKAFAGAVSNDESCTDDANTCCCGEECECDPCNCGMQSCKCGDCECTPSCDCGKGCQCEECTCDPCECGNKCSCPEINCCNNQ